MYAEFGWAVAAIMVVVVSWFFYRFVAPKSWREWTRAGLVQAFVIAFYAEMYGFPLTLYLLARFFNMDVSPTAGGNLWSQLFGFAVVPMFIAMLIGYSFVAVGIFLVAEGWREIYHARRQDRLATDGLYGVVRHPQYTGIFLAIFGEGVVHWPTVFSVVMFPLIVVAYVLLARKEEEQMIREFADRYREYQRSVPAFFPRWTQWRRWIRTGSMSTGKQASRRD